MLHHRVGRLRDLLHSATDLMAPWTYFHEELALREDFMQASRGEQHEALTRMLASIATRFLGRGIEAKDVMMLQVPDHAMWHGLCRMGPRIAAFFYFDALEKGLVGVMDNTPAGMVDLMRFSAVELPPEAALGLGSGGKA